MDSERSLEITNLQVLIGLRQEEEQRLRSISNASTSPEIRRQAQAKLREVLREIEADADDLARLEAGH